MAVNWKDKYEEARKAADKVQILEEIYDKVQDAYNWNYMEYHSADDEHEESWFTELEEGHYRYENAQLAKEIYGEVLAAIEKLAK